MSATLEAFMAQALQMEIDAVQRYNDFADMMETHNNSEVAQWFRKMALVEGEHVARIQRRMGWTVPPLEVGRRCFEGIEAPEAALIDEVHYLMKPWHVMRLALAAEERAELFFAQVAGVATLESVRQAALALQQEEAEHVQLVRAWLQKVAQPDSNWAEDPDPPRYDE